MSRRRLTTAYLLLALVGCGAVAAEVGVLRQHHPAPVAPEAVLVVRRFMTALSTGDRHLTCRLYPDLPACEHRGPIAIERYRIFPAEYTVDGVAVPVTIDDAAAEIDLQRNRRGTYRITTIIAGTTTPVEPPTELAA